MQRKARRKTTKSTKDVEKHRTNKAEKKSISGEEILKNIPAMWVNVTRYVGQWGMTTRYVGQGLNENTLTAPYVGQCVPAIRTPF